MELGKILLVLLITALLLSKLGESQLGKGCSRDSECGIELYCSWCKLGSAAKRCVRSTATNPFRLINNSMPLNKYSFLANHNAFAIEDGTPRFTFANQEDNITQQLNNGVRALMLDTYDFDKDIWLCHSFQGKCHDYTKFVPAVSALREIESFLSSNPSEIVTIILEDYVTSPKGLTNVFTKAGLMKYFFLLVCSSS